MTILNFADQTYGHALSPNLYTGHSLEGAKSIEKRRGEKKRKQEKEEERGRERKR